MAAPLKDNFKYTDEELNTLIHKYCNDFTENARQDLYDPITGREREIEDVILILLQKGRKNVMLQAPAGVGKTAMCVGLAQEIVKDNVPDLLKDARVLELDLASMAAGTATISEFQGRMIPVLKGIAERSMDPNYPKTILFIDEIHQIMPTCEGSSYKGLSEVMKPYLTSGALSMIGATTKDEYRIYVEIDPAMDRRFQKVELTIPNAKDTFLILQNLRSRYEDHHKIKVSDLCARIIVHLTNAYIRKRNQPDKAIITMDAASAAQVMHEGTGGELKLEYVYKMIERETQIHVDALGLTDKQIQDFEKMDDPKIDKEPKDDS